MIGVSIPVVPQPKQHLLMASTTHIVSLIPDSLSLLKDE